MTATPQFIVMLANLPAGERSALRGLTEQRLNRNLAAFDIFTGLWWPLRQRSPAAPRRGVAWLIARLYAAIPVPHLAARDGGLTLPAILGHCEPRDPVGQKRFRQRFDALLQTPLSELEPPLRWALSVARDAVAAAKARGIDWVQLTEDLSIWDRGEEHRRDRDVRDEWAGQYLGATGLLKERSSHADRNPHASEPQSGESQQG